MVPPSSGSGYVVRSKKNSLSAISETCVLTCQTSCKYRCLHVPFQLQVRVIFMIKLHKFHGLDVDLILYPTQRQYVTFFCTPPCVHLCSKI